MADFIWWGGGKYAPNVLQSSGVGTKPIQTNYVLTLGQCFPLLFSFKKIAHVRWNMAHETNEHHDGKTYYIWVQCKWFASIFKHNKIIHVNQLCCYCFLNCIHFWAISKFSLCVYVYATKKKKGRACVWPQGDCEWIELNRTVPRAMHAQNCMRIVNNKLIDV